MRLVKEKKEQNDLDKENTIVLTYKEMQYIVACVGAAYPTEVEDYLGRHNMSVIQNMDKVEDGLSKIYDEVLNIYENFLKED